VRDRSHFRDGSLYDQLNVEGFRISRQVKIGGFDHVQAVAVGGGLSPVIQTMWKDRLSFKDIEGKAGEALVQRIQTLRRMGCGLLRFAVPDMEAAEILGQLSSMVSMPLVADIHFDYKIALRCLDFPIAKIRINPGNLGPYGARTTREKISAVLSKAAARSCPVRIGVNAGSLPQDLRARVDKGLDSAEALVLAAERELAIFSEFNFQDVLVSMKASGIADTIKANRILAQRSDVPLHIGVTEAGPLIPGVVRNTAALMALLADGIGDTIRVSLSDTPEKEVIAGREILLAAAELANKGKSTAGNEQRPPGVRIVSCPRCGRNSFDTIAFAEAWQTRLYALDRSITVAIMGCAVNGPEEARHADLGITGTGNKVLIFRHGKLLRTIESCEADAAFQEELERL
jgi:(E)-4-hydroxy-3-methylbut-2-enyl-diphosphate synthase